MGTVVKIKVPAPVVTGGGINFDRWLELMRKIRQADLDKDLTAMQKYISEIEFNISDDKPTFNLTSYDDLIIKNGVMAEVNIKEAKNKLLALNSEVRQTVAKFEKDAKKIESINKLIEKGMQWVGNDKSRADQLSKALNYLKRVSSTHNGLLSAPLMTHAALSKAANSIRKAS